MRTILIRVPALLTSLWVGAAIWIDGPASRPVAGALAAAFLAATAWAIFRPRTSLRSLLALAALFGPFAIWWLSLEPSNDREWLADVAHPASAVIDGDRVTIKNLRNFHYRSENDYTENWEERRYDLTQLVGADLFLCTWGSPYIAHTIISWDFADAPPLAISIETRKETGEVYSAVRGFFRQFEIYYVVADEGDVVRLRTNHRGDQCRLYRLTAPPEQVRDVLMDYLEEINRLAFSPEWYNAASHNCTTTIRHHVQHVGAGNPWDWRILVNGSIDELGWERGTIDSSLPFDELRERSYINDRARAAGDAADFSRQIRAGLPPRHGPNHDGDDG